MTNCNARIYLRIIMFLCIDAGNDLRSFYSTFLLATWQQRPFFSRPVGCTIKTIGERAHSERDVDRRRRKRASVVGREQTDGERD